MTPPESEVTLGELSRGLGSLEQRINDQFKAVNDRLDKLEFVPRREFEIQIAAIEADVKEIKDDKTWTRRALVGSFLFPVLVAVVVALVVTR